MDRECAAVRALVAAAGEGRGGALVLVGPYGSGRSRLVAEALHEAAALTTLVAAGGPVEQTIPYSGLENLLRPVMHLVDELPPGQARTLRRAVLEGRCGHGRQLRLGLAVLAVLRAAAETRPVLCCLDDAHLLDRASADVLSFVAGRLAGERVAVLATRLADSAGGVTGPAVTELRLGPLDHDACREVLADLHPSGVAGPVAAAVVELSGGLPGALVDLGAALSPAQLRGAGAAPRTLPRASRLREVMRTRVEQLSAPAAGLLRLASVDEALTVTEALRAARVARVGGLDELLTAGLVVIEGDALRPAPPWLAGAVREESSAQELRTAHETMTAVLDPHAAPLRHRLHRAETRPPRPEEADELARLAEGGAPVLASRALEHAAVAAGDLDTATRRLEAAAVAAWRSGDPHRARELQRRVTTLAGAGVGDESRSRMLMLTGEMELRSGAVTTARGSLVAAARVLADTSPDEAVEALALAGDAMAVAGDYVGQEDVARLAGELPVGDAPRAALLVAYLQGVDAMTRQDYTLGRAYLTTVVDAVSQAGGPLADDASALVRAATAAVLVGDDLAARRAARSAVAAARQAGDAVMVPQALELTAYADWALGRHESAIGAATESVRLARATGQDGVADNCMALLALLAAISGDRTTCHLRLRALRVTSDGEPTAQTRGMAAWALAVLDLHGGRAAAAVARLRAMVMNESTHGHLVVQVPATFYLAEAVARWGDAPEDVVMDAALALDMVEGWTTSTGNPTWMALTARARAQLAAEMQVAEEQFRQAVALHRAGESDFAYARTELLFGEELRRHRRPAEAREHLRSAAEVFEQLQEPAWAERASAELRAAGEQSSGPRTLVTTGLTPRQEQIARLVANGATNREVAAQMFLSTRTVDHHLRGIFTRLGVRSRTELAKLLA